MYRRALDENTLGSDHASTLLIVNNFGNLYADQNKLKEAEKMFRRALEGYENTLGPDHKSTLNSVYYLGILYQKQDKQKEAEKMYRRALAGYEKALCSSHTKIQRVRKRLNTLMISSERYNVNLAKVSTEVTLWELKKFIAQLTINLPLVPLTLYLYASGHPKKFLRLDRQGIPRDLVRDDDQDIQDFHDALAPPISYSLIRVEMDERLFDMHRLVQLSVRAWLETSSGSLRRGLSDVLTGLERTQGKYERRKTMHRRALEARERVLGPEHPDTLTSVSNLGLVLYRQGKYEEAEAMHRRALEALERVLGHAHPDMVASINVPLDSNQREKHEEASVIQD
ncbi:kinesin light chain, putative [Talaromyces stipitatus ATCC 10500]|uniref:Kinesin light chain, putative n=1 Tax=Talaromyces stipitatus (strain ATCC 10500 / CBS 375.48 / QM 6759 / NRRL 1006) TaxID=441959 RepID=B8MPI6_TALSN|nr:kinesin light chain, putative [Talaromyces stipitatus ATCC 10500]EED14425.1 kinesin light chain, putative [Talaromyces stipitatus ATCC 10500]